MILKQLRLTRGLSQEQLALMSGLNVRTIQRIESGENASLESLKCLAATLEVELATLNQEVFMPDRHSEHWQSLPTLLKCWFAFNYFQTRPSRKNARRIEGVLQTAGFILCCLGLLEQASLVGGLMLLASSYFFHFLKWQGDKYAIWYDEE